MKKLLPEVDLNSMGIHQTKEETEPEYYSVYRSKKYSNRFSTIFKNLEERMEEFEMDTVPQRETEVLLRKVEDKLGRKLPDSLLAFYMSLNGFRLDWQEPENTEYRYFSVHFPEIHDVFCGFNYTDNPKDPNLFKDLLVFDDDENRAFAQQCYPIAIEEFHTTAILFVEGQEEPDLYLFVLYKPYKLAVSFTEYIERFLETRGLVYWQYQLIDKEVLPVGTLDLSNDFVSDMKKLFPEVDLSPYRQE